jgi:hypothetical protein
MKKNTWTVSGVLLLAGLSACGGGGSGGGNEPVAAEGALVPSRPGELTAYVQGRLRAQSSAAGVLDGAWSEAAAAAAAAGDAAGPRSFTHLQEAGVDEPDLLQSDGRHLYTLQAQTSGARVQVYARGSDGRALPLRTVDLPAEGSWAPSPEGMVFSADRRALAVLSRRWQPYSAPASGGDAAAGMTIWSGWLRSSVAVQRIDIGDPAAARVAARVEFDGNLVESRRVGNHLLVLSTYTPTLRANGLAPGSAEREAAIAALGSADLLPRLRRNGGEAQALLGESDCWLQPANGSDQVQITTLTVFDLASPNLDHRSRCFVGGSEALYMTTTSLYLATSRQLYTSGSDGLRYPAGMRTDLHKFGLAADGSLAYRASGQVQGHLGWDPQRKSYRLSEHNGDLRVLSYTGSEGWGQAASSSTAPSPALLTVLRERTADATLQVLATLPNAQRSAALGKPGEQVYGVRFDGARGYLVTFRRVDPLYVLDLSNPADPQLAGALEVPGFSDQLFPLDGGLLLGVGRDVADSGPNAGRPGGVKLALFDVARASEPRQLASLTLGDSGSSSALDGSRHGLNGLMLGPVARLALPMTLVRSDGNGTWQGSSTALQRFEVDTQARTLRQLAAVGSREGYESSWAERSLQIGNQAYYLTQAGLGTYDW